MMDIRGGSCGIADARMPEEIANNLRLSLPPEEITTKGSLQSRLVRRVFFPVTWILVSLLRYSYRFRSGLYPGSRNSRNRSESSSMNRFTCPIRVSLGVG